MSESFKDNGKHSDSKTDKDAQLCVDTRAGNNINGQIWQKRWFQICLGAIAVLVLAALVLPPIGWFIYATRSVLLPILIALVLAYAVNPLVKKMEKRGIPRPASAGMFIVVVFIAVALLAVFILPIIANQTADLVSKLPAYYHQFLAWTGINPQALLSKIQDTFNLHTSGANSAGASPSTSSAPANINWSAVSSAILAGLDIGYRMVSSIIGLLGYIVLAVTILLFCFFFFVWKLDHIAEWFIPFIPASRRHEVLLVVHKMDLSVSGFIHGRLLQALGVATVLSIGWGIVGVPYWLLLGISAGILNLIPYAAVVSWPLAIGLTWLNAVTGTGAQGFSFWWVIVAPTVVYLIGQGLDSWVVEPLVQGKATDLDPLTVLVVVLIGGALAGLLGMIIAIPLAACIKIFAHEIALPKLRKFSKSI